MDIRRLPWWVWLALGGFAFLAVGAMFTGARLSDAANSPPSRPPPPATSAPAETLPDRREITSASVEGGIIEALPVALRDGRRFGRTAPIDITVDVVDGYGNESTVRALTLSWAPEDEARINWPTTETDQLAELAVVTAHHRIAAEAYHALCADGNADARPRFCHSLVEALALRLAALPRPEEK